MFSRVGDLQGVTQHDPLGAVLRADLLRFMARLQNTHDHASRHPWSRLATWGGTDDGPQS